jgi:hypothetical protein
MYMNIVKRMRSDCQNKEREKLPSHQFYSTDLKSVIIQIVFSQNSAQRILLLVLDS